MRRGVFSTLMLSGIVLFVCPATAVERHVPNEYSTIQAAIDDCNNNDVVIIEPNTYTGAGNRDLDFGGLAITVRSTNPEDPCVVAATIINCQNSGRGFYFHSGEDANSIISGLTITNGREVKGVSCSPVNAYGGGIYCGSGTNPHISNCIISNNLVQGSQGCDEYYEIVGPNMILIPATDGGDGYGGGIYCHPSGGATITNCTFKNNQAIGGDSGDFIESVPYGGESFGGAICANNNLTVKNCLIYENQSIGGLGIFPEFGWGSGIYCITSNISNCTIINNSSGIYNVSTGIHGSASAIINNCIIRGHDSDVYDCPNLSYSCTSDSSSGTGVIHDDPCFVTGPEGDYYLSQIAAGQAVDSPCLDAGGDTAANLGMNLKTTRTDDIPDTGIVDMGYHYPTNIGDSDLNGDAFVDFVDYAILADDWQLVPDPCGPNNGDIVKDSWVDIYDLAALVKQWLACFVTEAFRPEPAHGATDISRYVVLGWTPGENIDSHDVYFGTDFNEVNDSDIDNPVVYMGNQDVNYWDTNNYAPNGLTVEDYYWRIDERGPACSAKGNVWSFTVLLLPGQASNPAPTNGATDVDIITDLSWTAGDFATSHDVYFGTVNPPPFQINQTGTTYDTGTMDINTTYYWRIDEKNTNGMTIGNTWNFKTMGVIPEFKLTASDGAGGDFFGYAVSISGDRCIVGANWDDDMGSKSGSAYIYEWNGSNWTQQAKLTASDGAGGDEFGCAVSISGDRCIVGANGDDDMGSGSGSAYIYEWNGANWTQQAKLTASDGASLDFFGRAVSISGDRCIVGANGDDDMGSWTGSAYIYESNDANWTQQTKLTASDGAAGDEFGFAVSISGDRCIVGSRFDDDMGGGSGSAYIYEWNGANWQQAKLTASDGAGGDEFGCAVSISSDRCIVGSCWDDDMGSGSGSAYIYEWNGANWTQQVKLTASDGSVNDLFGLAVSISGDRCIVGSSFDDDMGGQSGSAYIYELGP